MNIDEILNDGEVNELNQYLLKTKHQIENENLILFGSGNLGRKIATYFKEKDLKLFVLLTIMKLKITLLLITSSFIHLLLLLRNFQRTIPLG